MNGTSSRPTDGDFVRIENARKTALSRLIRESKLSLSCIARGAHVERRAVRRAADCDGIRFDTAVRIEYYLQWYLTVGKHELENQSEDTI